MGGAVLSKLYVVGIGPGGHEHMTIRADRALRSCDVIAGYHVYVDLVRGDYPGKEYLTTGMTGEVRRCEMALEEARKGRTVAMVCSGDSGVYGMAGLIYQLRGESAEPEVEVIPGLTAALRGGALLGAPLTHDFAVISLSDRLTSWDTIAARLRAAAGADMAIAIYNPESRTRSGYLRRAAEILLEQLPPDRPCGVAHNIGREGERGVLTTLEGLLTYPADMFCTVFVGNSSTQVTGGRLVTPRGYRDV